MLRSVLLAVGGYTTYQLMPTGNRAPTGRPDPDTAKNLTKALSLKPEVLLLSLGSNDIGSGYAASEYEANYDSIRAIAVRAGVRTWISTCMPRTTQDSAGRKKIVALRARIMQRYAPQALDFYDSLGMPDGTYYPAFNSGDGIHTNNRGHLLLYKRVVAANLTVVPAALASESRSRLRPHAAASAYLPYFHLDPGSGTRSIGLYGVGGAGGAGFGFDARGRLRVLQSPTSMP